MTLLQIVNCPECELPVATGFIIHNICQARKDQGLPPLKRSDDGCVVCGGLECWRMVDNKGNQFYICNHCRLGTKRI